MDEYKWVLVQLYMYFSYIKMIKLPGMKMCHEDYEYGRF